MKIAEIDSSIWTLQPTFSLKIDRSGVTVADYLKERDVIFISGDEARADVRLYKENLGHVSPMCIWHEASRRFSGIPYLSLIGEPREHAPAAYQFARQCNTLAVAPGSNLKRLYFASEWIDPQLEDWHKRLNTLCWIARPTPERIKIAGNLIATGIPLHIYSRESWPFDQWKGFAADEIETSRQYQYRIVCENSCRYGYHSEKLFNSIRSGCVTFYSGDSSLNLPHLTGAYLRLTAENMQNSQEHASTILKGMERVMFSSDWEIYSFRMFYDRIIDLASEVLRAANH